MRAVPSLAAVMTRRPSGLKSGSLHRSLVALQDCNLGTVRDVPDACGLVVGCSDNAIAGPIESCMRHSGVVVEDRGLVVRQQSLEKCGLCFKEIWPRGLRSALRQRFQRQQDRSLGIAARCGLLRKKRKRKRLVAQRLVARLKRLLFGRPALSALSSANSACRVASCCPLNPTNAPAPAMRANTVATMAA